MNNPAQYPSCQICQLSPFCKENEKCSLESNCFPTLSKGRLNLKRGESLNWSSENLNIYMPSSMAQLKPSNRSQWE